MCLTSGIHGRLDPWSRVTSKLSFLRTKYVYQSMTHTAPITLEADLLP